MSEKDYWKARCRRAEGLLAKARNGLYSTRLRTKVLCLLGDLKPGQWMTSTALARATGAGWTHLCAMEELGLVVSRPSEDGVALEWQLEHLVLVPEGGAA